MKISGASYPFYTYVCIIQGVQKDMGIQWRIQYRLCFELALPYLFSKAIINYVC